MGGESASTGDMAKPVLRWPEKVNRVLVVLVFIILVVGTPLASMITLSKHIEERSITIRPDSYYVLHQGIYGYGSFDMSYRCYGGDEGYLIRLDRLNYWLFKAGYDYEYMRHSDLGSGSGGGIGGGGIFWETYYVFVNDGHYSMDITITLDSNAYYSFPIALLLLGAMAFVGYEYSKRMEQRTTAESGAPRVVKSRTERRKAIVFMTWISLLVIGMTIGFGLLTSLTDVSGLLSAMLLLLRLWFFAIIGIVIVFKFGHRLQVVEGDPGVGVEQLAHRLRISGYMVSKSKDMHTIRISTTSAIRVFAKSTPEGALIKYRAGATPRGLCVIVFLMLSPYASFLGFVISLFMLYRAATFADVRIIPRMHQLSKATLHEERVDTRDMLIDSLSEGRRLSVEAYEAARSNYHDMILLLVTLGIVLSTVFAAVSYLSWPQDLDSSTRGAASILSGLAVGSAIPIIGWRVLGANARGKIDDLKRWTAELEKALQREISSMQVSDDESSSFELIAESCKVVPEWIRVRRKGRMYRDPVSWILIFMLSLAAFELAITGVLSFDINSALSTVFLGVSACLVLLVAFIYHRWRRRQAEDDRELKDSLKTRFRGLKEKMEAYLGSV